MLERILNETSDIGIELYLSGGRLRSKGPRNSLSEELELLIRQYRDELICYLETHGENACKPKLIGVVRANVSPPLSHSQRRLWLIDQLGEGSAQYNMPGRFRLKGKIDYEAFNKTLETLIDRHKVICSNYISENGEPQQILRTDYELPLKKHDLSQLSANEQESAVSAICKTEANSLFDLSSDLMLRVRLIKLAGNDHVILYTMHHIASDGWSMAILKKEFAELYSAYSNGQDNPLDPLPLQYSDYSRWQREILSGDTNSRGLEYWRKKLHAIKPLELPTDMPRTTERNYHGQEYEFILAEEVVHALSRLGKRNGATLFMVLLSVFQILLSRYCNQDDIVVVSPESGRSNSETQEMIGFFVNLLLMRTEVDEGDNFYQVLAKTKETSIKAYANQEIPYDYLIAELNKDLGESAKFLSRVSFALNEGSLLASGTVSDDGTKLGDLILQPFEVEDQEIVAKTDLSLEFTNLNNELTGRIIYDRDLFNSATIERMGLRFIKLIEQIVGDPEKKLNTIDLTLDVDMKSQTSNNLSLSSAQKGIWLDLQAFPEKAPTYNLYEYLEINGKFHPNKFIKSIEYVVDHTAALRLRFKETSDGLLTQTIEPKRTYQVEYVDITNEDNPEQWLAQWVNQLREKPIEPSSEIPFRFVLLKLSEQKYCWFSHYHHLIVDGIAMGAIRQRVSQTYNHMVNLDALPVFNRDDFTEYLTSLSEYKFSHKYRVDKEYWESKLNTVSSVNLSVNSNRIASSQSIRVSKLLSVNTADSLRKAAADRDTSFSRLMFAAIALYLKKVSGVGSLTLGLQTHGRFSGASKGVIAPCSKILPVFFPRFDGMNFDDFVDSSNSWVDEAISHGEFMFEEVFTSQGKTPYSSGIYDVIVNILSNLDDVELDDTVSQLHSFPRYEENLVIRVYFARDRDEVHLHLDGNARLFEEWELQLHLERLSEFLRRFVDTSIKQVPASNVEEISVLSESEEQTLLNKWNLSKLGANKNCCIHELFEERATEFPDSIAIEHMSEKITYQELNKKANQLAHNLVNLGVKPEKLVGIFLSRSIDMVIGVLGILKAGGAYVPLDPEYPEKRIDYILDDAGIDIVLTLSEYQKRFDHRIIHVVEMDKPIDTDVIDNIEDEHISSNILPSEIGLKLRNLAYVMYTSGSAGMPKGVMIEHSQITDFMSTVSDFYGWDDHDRVLQFATINFDISVEEIFGALSAGATLVLRTEEWVESTECFWKLCDQHDISVLDLPTAFWHSIIPSPEKSIPRCLRQVIIGGEKINYEKSCQWFALKGRLPELVNSYGPTETTIVSTCHVVNEKSNAGSIGKPVVNTSAYILDSTNNVLPIGVAGELCIGGKGVSRGYLNRDSLTDEKFILDPFNSDERARLYKTGDLVRWLQNGEIEFLGRIDNQVKIRGFRVELGEVESQLNRHSAVDSAVVIVNKEAQQLIAYLVLNISNVDFPKEKLQSILRDHLLQDLPEYMVPSAYIELDELPLTINGKLDIESLPSVDSESYAREEFIAPRTNVEKVLAEIWSEILNFRIEEISCTDNFFALGGHSLLATRLANLILRRIGKKVNLRAVFKGPTISQLAEIIELQPVQIENLPLSLVDRSLPVELSFAQQRLWFLSKLEGTSANYNIPMALRLSGKLNKEA
ncbi:MAG: hypothetical protein COA78_38775, partial [Blastopirellula sp.]